MMNKKDVDESWKQAAERDKLQSGESGQDDGKLYVPDFEKKQDEPVESKKEAAPSKESSDGDVGQDQPSEIEVNFLNYVSSLAFQSMIFLGEIAHPHTNEIEKNLDQAKFLIDTLVVIREKTKGNLEKKEEDLLNASIYELQMKYVDQMKKGESSQGESSQGESSGE